MVKLKGADMQLMKMVNSLGQRASTLSILEALEIQTGKKMSIGYLHKNLIKLWDLGLLDSEKNEATFERGGRRKRKFTVTAYGYKSMNLIYGSQEFK